MDALEEIAPKLVLDKHGCSRMYHPYEVARRTGRVERQVSYNIGSRIVLAHVVPRGGKERQQDPHLGHATAQGLQDGTTLFELSQRGGMEPHDAAALRQGGQTLA